MSEMRDALIVGAGPTGLACGIEAVRASLALLILEKGCVVNSLFSYPANMTFFTTRERLEIGDLPFSSINVKPTRAEALEYYRRAADYFKLPIRYSQRVTAIQARADAFRVIAEDPNGREAEYFSRGVIVATGYYDRPNRLGIPGEDLPKVSHYALEGHAFYGRKVAVIGGANSAAITALDLYRHGAEVTLIHRAEELSRHIKYWVRPDLENRIKEKSIRACLGCRVTEIREDTIAVANINGEASELENDFVFALTGYHPDIDLLQRAGVAVDPKSFRPACNPKTLETNVPGLYVAGVVISGRHTNEIFIENGRFHGKQIIEDMKVKLGSR
ncbi:MAG TPA: YpdA family putative bacillithiol disulfide reductase [Terriglobia bacterium]|nr:YpdA family putative bacillithiol disulfide reductase [Terriglobia bacterium]